MWAPPGCSPSCHSFAKKFILNIVPIHVEVKWSIRCKILNQWNILKDEKGYDMWVPTIESTLDERKNNFMHMPYKIYFYVTMKNKEMNGDFCFHFYASTINIPYGGNSIKIIYVGSKFLLCHDENVYFIFLMQGKMS
jgi:hypothetical protein